MGRRTDPFSKIFLCQVSAPTCKRNCLTESGQAARNWQWWRGLGAPSARPTVIEPLDKLNLRNRQGARRLPEHQKQLGSDPN